MDGLDHLLGPVAGRLRRQRPDGEDAGHEAEGQEQHPETAQEAGRPDPFPKEKEENGRGRPHHNSRGDGKHRPLHEGVPEDQFLPGDIAEPAPHDLSAPIPSLMTRSTSLSHRIHRHAAPGRAPRFG